MLNLLYSWVTPWGLSNKAQIFRNRLVGKLANFIYPKYCGVKRIPKMIVKNQIHKVVVSLTSYPARIEKVYLCIESILRQTEQADEVILWLAENQFPDKKKLPAKLLRLEEQGLSIRFCDDLKSFKKIFYTAQEYTEDIIITADDDVYYPENWIERLLKTAQEYPKLVCCYRADVITFDNDGNLLPYRNWNGSETVIKGPSPLLLPTGVGGVLYPTNYFQDVDFNIEIIKKLCPTADDLWLKAIALTKGVYAVKVDSCSKEWFTVNKSQKGALTYVNVGCNKNDLAIDNLINHFAINIKKYATNSYANDGEKNKGI